jgi:prevent-host-death family protein
MPKINPGEDIHSLSEVRANFASFVDRVRETDRAVVLTDRGRGAAVLMGVAAYQSLLEELELLRDIRAAEEQLAAGQVLSHTRAKREVTRRLRS